ncbi:hypothetical protein DH2020_002240 [Rehmannia glutinosa]|uniref:RCK N-terminal domain-containing protein n=1 Tax=Rehmannia glutinosa TaxID=99300 RepID=A0ABR0XTE2_REHGL
MDVACSLSRSNVFMEVKSLVAGHWSDLNIDVTVISLEILDFPQTKFPKKLKKNNTYCFSSASPRTLNEGNFWLWCYGSNGSSFFDTDKTSKISKHVGMLRCQGNESLAYVNGNGRDAEITEIGENGVTLESNASGERSAEEGFEAPGLDELRELLQKALKDLEVARLSSTMFEEKAQKISEAAIALKDEAENAWDDVNIAVNNIQEIVNEEAIAKDAVQKATMALSFAEARLQVTLDSLKLAKENNGAPKSSKESNPEFGSGGEESSEEEALLAAQQDIKESQDHLAICEAELRRVQSRKEELQKELDRLNAVAEQAQTNVSKAEEDVANIMLLAEQAVAHELEAAQRVDDAEIALQRAEKNLALSSNDTVDSTLEETIAEELSQGSSPDGVVETNWEMPAEVAELLEPLPDGQLEGLRLSDESDKENGKLTVEKETEADADKLKTIQNEEEFTPASVFRGLVESARKQLPKLVFGSLLLGAGSLKMKLCFLAFYTCDRKDADFSYAAEIDRRVAFYVNRGERFAQLYQQPEIITTSIDEVSTTAKPLVNEEEASLFDMLWLLLASVVFVPIFQKVPGGSPVLGYLAAGILIGPYGLSIIRNVHGTKAIAEFGVVFLLFNIGLEVLVTAVVVGLLAHYAAGLAGPAAIVIGNGLALSSTAVVLQVLQERGFGCGGFAYTDTLISPSSSKGGVGFQAIAEALGLAAVKAVVAISAIIAGGRLLLRPIYKQIAENQNAEIFSANTLLVILGLSMALGAFLAGLLLAETEFSLQVESDIAPYRGLLLDFFGISMVSAIRVGLLLAPGGEFAFVAFGEAVNQGIMSPQLSSLLFLVVGISMALTPWLAAGGQLIASRFELHDVRSLLPVESETDDLQDHIIICGFGRVGQIIAQLLSERLIPFVALDVRSDRVAVGRSLDLPVYFGDAGSREVLHKVGAERACAAAVTLDSPGANYRTVWALSKYFPNVKTFVRAHDVDHGLNLEKAGATAAKLPMSEIAATINEFRSRHLSELAELCETSGSSLGYGFSRMVTKPKSQPSESLDENHFSEGTLAI